MHIRTQRLVAVATAFFASPLSAQTPVRVFDGQVPVARLGSVVAWAGDVDADGVDDLVVGWPHGGVNGAWSGTVRVLSGRHGEELLVVHGAAAGDRFGHAVSGAGDVDGDGFEDIVVGAPYDDRGGQDAGAAIVLAGGGPNRGAVLHTALGATPFEQFGMTVAGPGDMDGDMVPDFLVGAPLANVGATILAGRVCAVSGANGAVLRTWTGSRVGDNFGWTLAPLGDLDGDGAADFAVAAIDRHRDARGSVTVVSGLTGAVIHTITSATSSAEFGFAIAGGEDLDGDGERDLVVGSPYTSRNVAVFEFMVGAVEVFSLADGRSLARVEGPVRSGRFGESLALIPDTNGDGRMEVAVGGLRNNYSVWSLDPVAGLTSLGSVSGGGRFGARLAGGGDVDGDGHADLLIGAEFAGALEAGSCAVHGFQPRTFVGLPSWISIAAGGAQAWELDAGAAFAGRSYVVVGSASGTEPGLPLGGATLPLVFDDYSQLTLTAANQPPFFASAGTLDAAGRASGSLQVSAAVFAGLQGVTLDHAFLLLPGVAGFDFASNPVPLRLLP